MSHQRATFRKWFAVQTAAAAIVCLAVSAVSLKALDRGSSSPAFDDLLTALKNEGTKASITIYPVRVLGRPSRNVGDALGLVLEKSGMNNLEAGTDEFLPKQTDSWEDAPKAFAEFLKQNPPKTAYALYAEYLGNPKTGPTEVRWLIATNQGVLVCSDRQTPKDKDFARTAGRDPDPMGCSVLVAERMFGKLAWKKSTRVVADGKFAKIWAEKSGLPAQAEFAAIKERQKKWRQDAKKSRLGVYPTRVGPKTDAQSASRLQSSLGGTFYESARIVDSAISIAIEPSSNQQKRLWDLARQFQKHIRANPPDTEYAILANYIFGAQGQPVRAVNFVVCDRNGDWVIVDFQNDQQPDFKRIMPKTIAECDQLVVMRIKRLTK